MSNSLRPPKADRALSGRAAIVGVGETDYADDYRAFGRGERRNETHAVAESLLLLAFERALADADLKRSDIDGIVLMPEMVEPDQRLIDRLGASPRHVHRHGWLNRVGEAAQLLATRRCDTIALLFVAPSRSGARIFGGSSSYNGGGRESYYYYHPWHWSSQAAHWALMFQFYRAEYGASEEDLGHVAIGLRRNAMLTEDAVMRTPLTLDDYLSSRYIVEPMHLFDICMVNDGAVCVLMQRTDQARDRPHVPVVVSGWGYSEIHHDKLDTMIRSRLRPQMSDAVRQALTMADLSLRDIGHLMAYDPSTIQLVNQLEGFGFAAPGEGIGFVKEGHAAIGGSLPVNTNGGMLSHSYMAGWNNLVETVRQLRHEAGPRQVDGLAVSLFATTTTDSTNPYILTRGGPRD